MRIAPLMFVVTLTLGGADSPSQAQNAKEAFKLSKDEQAVLDLVNAERAKEKLSALKANEFLTKAARDHSANMAKQGKLDHTLDDKGPDERVKALGYQFSRVGENIAWGQSTPAAVMESWLSSTDHKANILGEYTEFGIGYATDADGRRYWTQVFATPASR